MLTNIYPNASGRESVYVTNKSLQEVLSLEQFPNQETAIERGISVLNALASTDGINSEEVLDYAYRPLNTNAMLFDIYSDIVNHDESISNFLSVVRKLDPRFIVMDLSGDINSSNVKPFVDACDVILYVVRPVKRDFDEYLKYYQSLTADERLKVKLVCNIWDETGVKKSTIQEYSKIKSKDILWFPYHFNISRSMFEGRLCILNRLLIEGRDNCLKLRQPLHDILSFICNTSSIKVIKEVSKWQL